MKPTDATPPPAEECQTAALQAILDALRGLRFGSVTVVVQDSVIVQIERLEKKRLARPAPRESVA